MRSVYLLLLGALVLSSCSAFRGSRKMDMSPFSENTQTLFGEALKIERPFQFKYLKTYREVAEYRDMLAKAPPALIAIRGIIYYSNQVVAINNSKLSERSKAEMLALYLTEVMEKALTEDREDSLVVDLSRARFILDNIRNSKTYLDAIAAAEPIVHGVVAAVLERIDEIQNDIPLVMSGFGREIEKQFSSSKENYRRLTNLQEKNIFALTRLYKSWLGDKSELEALLAENPSLKYFIPSIEKVNHDQLLKAEQFLLSQSREIDTLVRYLDESKAEYVAQQGEIENWRMQLDEKIMIGRTALSIWARAHKNLGAGIPVPPMIDISGIASNLAGNAAKAVIP